MESLGICIGASSIGMVRLRRENGCTEVIEHDVVCHEGNSRQALLSMLSRVEDLKDLRVAATGRKFRHLLALPTISEPEAVELATAYSLPEDHSYRTVISAGGETFLVYSLRNTGEVEMVHTGNKCASGTGEFLLQQLGRMALSLDELAEMDFTDEPHKVSGRCSVFCKSDCTHALNKGVEKGRVVSGLSKMMAGKCLELLKKLPKDKAVLVGGCSDNEFMVRFLRDEIPDLHIPEEARWFEALGAGLWALDNAPDNTVVNVMGTGNDLTAIFKEKSTSFAFHSPLSEFSELVEFKTHPRGQAQLGDECILGLDVGSTTTKGVVMRTSDLAVIADEYLRTDGDPVGASRRVYSSLADQIDVPISIVGLGVTGSGRAISGLHAQTDGVINEIIAHATASVHFDPEVDTIFEIGGQDAKYTYITAGVPSDYAMNEACSAGTGSFLEESAKESLGVETTEIGEIALQANRPPNFNDQCAAFISSDIKIAIQEGMPLKDIVAGLVYSVCMNYDNRVKGNRPVGKKVFMQGGVCYNEAVPVAMAALTGKHIVVPPEPGLMGAFGVALEVKKRIGQGLLTPSSFDLNELAAREVSYKKTFTCTGGSEKCDLGCEIARIVIDGSTYPFGGICNRWENLRKKRGVDTASRDLVAWRERRCFRDAESASSKPDISDNRPVIGINRSYLVNTYYPLFSTFFQELGYRVVLPQNADTEAMGQRGAAFCFPGEIAHGFMGDLLAMEPDYLFLPHVRGIPTDSNFETSCTCVLVQGEPYYLRTAFPQIEAMGDRAVFPVLDFSKGLEAARKEFLDIGVHFGASKQNAEQAYKKALTAQRQFHADLQKKGKEVLNELEQGDDPFAVVLIGRPYNAFAGVANKGIPAKFASTGVTIIPFDMLPLEEADLEQDMNMYWGMGRLLLKASRLIKDHPKLFGSFITNFSCGPDSFLLSYFREIMGRKPSLTLELDNHTADAGIETRVEAFLDIIRYYQRMNEQSAMQSKPIQKNKTFKPAVFEKRNGDYGVVTSDDVWLPLTHERVKVVFPSMGEYSTRMLAASLRSQGIRAEALPPADEERLKIGRGNSTCKECLPLQLTVGSILHYLQHRDPEEVTVYFMPSADGPCRFGQYHVYTQRLFNRKAIPNAPILTPTCTDGYGGLNEGALLSMWRSVVISDVFEEMKSTVLAGARDRETALALFNTEFMAVTDACSQGWKQGLAQLKRTASTLSEIELRMPYEELPKISLIGEIFVRHDVISRQGLIERMADRGIVVRTAQGTEWIKYTDWLIMNGIEGDTSLAFWMRLLFKKYYDTKIRNILSESGLFYHHKQDIPRTIEIGSNYVSPKLAGEAILTVGAAFHEIFHPSCGIISIGPFGCMPSRVAEAILSEKFTTQNTLKVSGNNSVPASLSSEDRKLPFLAIETDGNPFPQIVEARLEAFALQARRLHKQMM
ncbi:acyl-CoA dehydratase activase [Halodesulfovibrio marinisediminis]|uniref:CoA-substrate-specific enzyme activase, putative n=1 Tax=Halodesulfovibrio marinisediminis DSM 17456 TaxID=1121457 RepID=A0A1N6EAP8_9BACT|nr:acyl-CoA dehydratase activase [Halodesulfovibrio marinisediminis]SIN80099.1 CoA-substrate-specific enzyme activase, putative [Halodesulfovibrio marinisediminis DSM 17456]